MSWNGENGALTLGDLIARLERVPAAAILRPGLTHPHSYRGDYRDLAFEPMEECAVGEALAEARGSLGRTFTGYKGGDYTMNEFTSVWISEYGSSEGAQFSGLLLRYMLNDGAAA